MNSIYHENKWIRQLNLVVSPLEKVNKYLILLDDASNPLNMQIGGNSIVGDNRGVGDNRDDGGANGVGGYKELQKIYLEDCDFILNGAWLTLKKNQIAGGLFDWLKKKKEQPQDYCPKELTVEKCKDDINEALDKIENNLEKGVNVQYNISLFMKSLLCCKPYKMDDFDVDRIIRIQTIISKVPKYTLMQSYIYDKYKLAIDTYLTSGKNSDKEQEQFKREDKPIWDSIEILIDRAKDNRLDFLKLIN